MTRPPHVAATAIVVLSALSLSTRASGQVAQSASMNLTASVNTGCDAQAVAGLDAWGIILANLNVTTSATASDCNQGGALSAFGSGAATWANAAAGLVMFTRVGITYDNAGGVATLNSGGGDWVYTFLATDNSSFTMDGSVVANGNAFGLWGWALSIDGGPEGLRTGGFQDATDPTDVWSFTGGLTAGNIYTAVLTNNTNLDCEVCVVSSSGSMGGTFKWQIVQAVTLTTTPEPASLALVLPGILAACFVARRKDKRRK